MTGAETLAQGQAGENGERLKVTRRDRLILVALVLVSVPTVMHSITAQFDGLAVGAAAVAWIATQRRRPWLVGLALVIATIKPHNLLLPLALIAWELRRWPLRALLPALLLLDPPSAGPTEDPL